MELLWWCTGALAVIGGMKLIFRVFKRIFSKDSIDTLIDSAGRGCNAIGDKMADSLKKRKEAKNQAERPVVTIH